jgi:predicted GH43/DUF377 family glycosyl hydrolase
MSTTTLSKLNHSLFMVSHVRAGTITLSFFIFVSSSPRMSAWDDECVTHVVKETGRV